MESLAKLKECKVVGEWEKSMINHLYWCVVSTRCGNGDVMKAKWLSLDNHLHDVHSGHSEDYPECSHGTLTENDRRKKWFRRRKYLMYHIFFMQDFMYIKNFKAE